MVNAFTLTNINTKITEGNLSKIFISEVCIKLVALRINRSPRSSSQIQKGWWRLIQSFNKQSVEFVLAPQHETSCDPETTTKEHFDYWRKITEESNLEVYRRTHDKSNEAED